MAQTVKNLPVMQETWVQSLGWEDPLEEGMATHSSILVWRIPMNKEEPGRLQSMGHNESDTTERLSIAQHRGIKRVHLAFMCIFKTQHYADR